MRKAVTVLVVLTAMLTSGSRNRVAANMVMYYDWTFQCTVWDGDKCWDGYWETTERYYDDGNSDGGGGGGGGEPMHPVTKITNVQVVENKVSIQLEPDYTSGRLIVRAFRTDGTNTAVYDETRGGGTFEISAGVEALPIGDYMTYSAEWNPAGVGPAWITGSFSLAFRALGEYHHTQYNTPVESTCWQGKVARDYAPGESCAPILSGSWRYDFDAALELNGTGVSDDYGVLHTSVATNCAGRGIHAYQIPAIQGANHNRIGTDTVAKMANHPDLNYHDWVFIIGAPGFQKKEVTDRCGSGCTGDPTHLDNWSDAAYCTPNAVGDLGTGHYRTIRLR